MNDFILKTSNLSIGYERAIIENISLHCMKGEIVHLVGDNGRGKSTFIKTILGKLAPIQGEIGWSFPFSTIAYLPQEFMDPKHWSISMGEISELFMLDQRNNPSNLLFSHTSGGQRQKIILDVLIAEGKEVLILDEPFNHLDLKTQDEIIKYLFTLIQSKKIQGVLITGHFRYEKLRVIEL
jgi:ATP-binding cassette, subfamily F, member 3